MKTLFERKVASEAMTQAVAQKIFDEYLKGEKNFSVFLEGGLGAGKTFFIRELLRLFEVKQDIPSPTYTYVQTYQAGAKKLAHFDLYRLKNSADFFERGLQEIAADSQTSCFVEWPQKLDAPTLKKFSGAQYTLVIKHGVGASMRTISLLKN